MKNEAKTIAKPPVTFNNDLANPRRFITGLPSRHHPSSNIKPDFHSIQNLLALNFIAARAADWRKKLG
jgi:hypothetical protein